MVRHIYFTNRKEYYRRQNISLGLKLYWKNKKQDAITQKVLRYSVSFIKVRGANKYNEVPRAYILNPSNTKDLHKRLCEALREKLKNNGGWYIEIVGLEKEEIDLVEAGKDPRNEILFEGFK